MGKQLNEARGHEHSKGEEVKTSQLFKQVFVVAGHEVEELLVAQLGNGGCLLIAGYL